MFSEQIALDEIGDGLWLARSIGDSVVVAIAADTPVTQVLLDIAQQAPSAKRQFIVQLGRQPRLLSGRRNPYVDLGPS